MTIGTIIIITLFVLVVTALTYSVYAIKHNIDNKFTKFMKKEITNKFVLVFVNIGFGVVFFLLGILLIIEGVQFINIPDNSLLLFIIWIFFGIFITGIGGYRTIMLIKKYLTKNKGE